MTALVSGSVGRTHPSPQVDVLRRLTARFGQYFTLPPLVRVDSARTLGLPRTVLGHPRTQLGLFKVVMLYTILTGFLSQIWK